MSLLALPPEIRHRIYIYYFLLARPKQKTDDILAFASPLSMHMRLEVFRPEIRAIVRFYDFFGSNEMTSILCTSKLICAEATAALYTTFTLNFHDFYHQSDRLKCVLPKVGPFQRTFLRSVKIVVGFQEVGMQCLQKTGVHCIAKLLPNLRHVSLIPMISTLLESEAYKPGDIHIQFVIYMMILFEYFPRANVWQLEHWERSTDVTGGRHMLRSHMLQNSMDYLQREIVKRNAEMAMRKDEQPVIDAPSETVAKAVAFRVSREGRQAFLRRYLPETGIWARLY